MGVVGAPGSYYLVFLVSGAGNLILYHAFLLSTGLENKPSMSRRRLNMERYHKVAIEVEAIDWLIGKEYKSERTSDRD